MNRIIPATLLALGLAWHPPLYAADEATPEELITEGVQRILDAMSLLLKRFPRYAAPEVLDNGDIIIRRKNPPRGDSGRGGGGPRLERTEAAGSA